MNDIKCAYSTLNGSVTAYFNKNDVELLIDVINGFSSHMFLTVIHSVMFNNLLSVHKLHHNLHYFFLGFMMPPA